MSSTTESAGTGAGGPEPWWAGTAADADDSLGAAGDPVTAGDGEPGTALAPGVHVTPSAPRGTWLPRASGSGSWLPGAATLAVVGTVIGVVLWQVHPSLLFADTSTTGGDTGAHYMMPAFFNTDLLNHFHLTGWDPDWYDGYPVYTFYFILPDVLVALASHVMAYNVAFKLATVLGSLLLPVTAWAMGRLFGLKAPIPAAAAASLPFLFDYTWTIYGGNLFSTLAGEYSYSLSIALALVFLGLFARGLRTGRGRALTAVAFMACVLAHIVPAVFAVAGAAVLTAMELLPLRYRLHDGVRTPSSAVARSAGGRQGVRGPWGTLWWASSTMAIGVALAAWWIVPFFMDQAYSTSMNYTKVTDYQTLLFPEADHWAIALAALALVVAVLRLSRFGIFLGVLAALSAAAVIFDPLRSLYNVRFLPLWFLCVYLLVGWLVGVSVAAAARWLRRERLDRWAWAVRRAAVAAPLGAATVDTGPSPTGGGSDQPAGDVGLTRLEWSARPPSRLPRRPVPPRWLPGAVAGPIVAILAALLVVVPPMIGPLAQKLATIGITVGANEVTHWSNYNYLGYTGQPDYPEYRGLMTLMDHIGHRYGCGRAMWEYNADENRFGTPEALMLLPYWTTGCIDSMEGLLFESSSTTPFHFINQAELSVSPSDAVFGLPYGSVTVPLGVQHLQLLGVRYYMAASPQTEEEAAADPTLELLASSGPWADTYSGQHLDTVWKVYLVKHSSVVEPLDDQPAVLSGVGEAQTQWLGALTPTGGSVTPGPALSWYLDPARWDVELTEGGPASWRRVDAAASTSVQARAVTPTKVSHIHQTDDSVSFHVSRTGSPVLVKISYFPNWHATGAEGPWRASPNLMVVVPTSHTVTLTYGRAAPTDAGDALTVVGAAVLAVLAVVYVIKRRRRPAAIG